MIPQARWSPERGNPRPLPVPNPRPTGLRRFRRSVVDLSLIVVTLGTLALYVVGWGAVLLWILSW